MPAEGYIIEQVALLCVHGVLAIIQVLEISSERYTSNNERVRPRGLKWSYHRLGLLLTTLLLLRDIDPRGAHDVLNDAWLALFANNATALLVAAVAVAFFCVVKPAFLIVGSAVPAFLRPLLTTVVVGAFLLAEIVAISAFVRRGPPEVPLKVDGVWMVFLALVFIVVVSSFHYVVVLLRRGVDKFLRTEAERRHNNDMLLGRRGHQRISETLLRMKWLQVVGSVIVIFSVVVQTHVAIECFRGNRTPNSALANPNKYEWHPSFTLLWLQTVANGLLVWYSWIPIRFEHDPVQISYFLEDAEEEEPSHSED